MPEHLNNKLRAHQGLAELALAAPESIPGMLADLYHPDARWCGAHPLNEVTGMSALAAVWRSMRAAFPDLERRDLIVVAGTHEDRDYVGMVGHYQGNFLTDWLGIPATGGVIHLRYGELHRFERGKIASTYALIDLLDLMRQAGVWPLAPALGSEGMWPGPATHDGVRLADHDADEGRRSVAVMQAMHRGLLDFDGVRLESMNHARYWTEDFMWYGPSGIGTTRGLRGFQAHHQIPFLTAFPDRRMGEEYICFGDGPYAATGGWPAMAATHTGGGWLGLPPTGRAITIRVMDFYRLAGERLAENWVPIDVLDVLHQLGLDVFARLAHRRGRSATE